MTLMVNAQDVGMDITSRFENTDFESNSNNGWSVSGIGFGVMNTAAANNYQGTYFMEAWCTSSSNLGDFDWSQSQSVPNGYYVVKALAHAIKQNQTKTPVPHGVYVYAEAEAVQVTTTTASEYVVLAKVTDGELTIGFRAENCDVNWVACDNFKVMQCFGDTENQAKISWMKGEMSLLSEEFDYLEGIDMSSKLWEEMEASVDAIETVSTYTEAEALYTKMKKQLADAEACIEAYEQLLVKIEEVLEFAEEQEADDLLGMAEDALAKYEKGAFSASGALSEIERLNDAVFEFNLEIADGTDGFEVTELFVKDASVRTKDQTSAWTIKVTNNAVAMPAWGHNCIEFWNCDFNMSQTLKDLPNGKYVVKVTGFYREAGNDAGKAHSNGTEKITAELFANNKAEPFTSIYKYTASEMGVTVNLRDGYVDGLQSAGLAFDTENRVTGKVYYAENEVDVIVTDRTLTFGVRNTSTVGNRWCVLRDFELWYYGNFPGVNLYGITEDINNYLSENVGAVPYAVQLAVEGYIDDILDEGYDIQGAYSDEEVNAKIMELEALWEKALQAADLFTEVKALKDKIEMDLLPLNYPGRSDLQAALNSMAPYLAAESTVNTYENLQVLKADIETAIYNYYISQKADLETAANYTPFVLYPNFEMIGNWVWSVTSTGGSDQWNGSCRPSEESGANRQGVNLWGTQIKSIDVHQVVTNLPDGLYKVSAEMITQGDRVTNQHVYAAGATKSVSENLTIGGWDTYEWTELTTDYAVVAGGVLSVGAESSQGGDGSEGWFQATNFKLYYYGPATAEQLKAVWEYTEVRADDALSILPPSEKKDLDVAMQQALPLAAGQKYGDACALVVPVLISMDSVITATKNFYEDYYAVLDTIRNDDNYEGCEMVYSFAEATIALADAILASDTTTCKAFPALNELLHAYADYASTLRDAECEMDDPNYIAEYVAFVNNSVIAPQSEILLAGLVTVEKCNDLRADLQKAIDVLKNTANYGKEINEGDVTYLIVNPTIDTVEGEALAGWTIVQNNAVNCGTYQSEHYSGVANNTYLDAWHPSAETMNATFYQDILGIPDGTYKLTVAARTDGDNAYIFAATTSNIADASTQWAEVKNYNEWRGEIWEADRLAWEAAGAPADDLEQVKKDYPYFMARPSDATLYGEGYGWSWHTIEVEVTNHVLIIGLTTDAELSGNNFTGTWMGADDWKLELVKKSDVQSVYNPFLDVEIVKVGDVNLDGFHTMSDVVMTVNSILGIVQENFYETLADVNGDGNTTIGDVISILRMVLTGELPKDSSRSTARRAASRMEDTSTLGVDECVLTADNRMVIPISLSNSNEYAAFQMDVALPAGVELVEAILSDRAKSSHTIAWNKLSDGSVRVVAYALNNATFKGNEGTLLNLVLDVTSGVSDEELTLTNGFFTTPSGAEDRTSALSVPMRSGTTDLNAVNTSVRMYGIKGAVVVESVMNQSLDIYSVAGKLIKQVPVMEGKTTIVLPAGVYVINGNKVIVK